MNNDVDSGNDKALCLPQPVSGSQSSIFSSGRRGQPHGPSLPTYSHACRDLTPIMIVLIDYLPPPSPQPCHTCALLALQPGHFLACIFAFCLPFYMRWPCLHLQWPVMPQREGGDDSDREEDDWPHRHLVVCVASDDSVPKAPCPLFPTHTHSDASDSAMAPASPSDPLSGHSRHGVLLCGGRW